MRIVVTGGAGFLGQYVVERLKNERLEVIPVDINPRTPETKYLDVTDFLQTNSLFATVKPDVVIHLAALAGSTGKGGGAESMKDPYNYFRVNVMGTLNIFEACRRNNICKVIHMSSFSVYGVTKEVITEETPLNPNNPYGFSKACGELIAKCYAMNYGIKAIIFRVPLMCGEGQRELNALREFVLSVKEGKPIVIFGEGKHVREWLHPIDVTDAFIKAVKYFDRMTNPYEVFILGNKPISMKDLAQLVIENMGKGYVEHHPSTRQVFDQYTDASKAKRLLGWEAKISVEEIVKRVVMDIFEGK
jgi:nucleoside-diphosphate-sugar epimerase